MQPKCNECGATGNGVRFSLFPKVPGKKFGEICVSCEDTLCKERQ